jgi:DNA-binding transcriptional LysR family regulator
MTLDDMRLFAKVVQTGSLSAAGRLLGVPKSTVSRRLAELEAALGVQLLNRTTRKIGLTEAGRVYFDGAVRVLSDADALRDAVLASHGEPSGTLVISVPQLFGEGYLGPMLARFAAQYPKAGIDVRVEDRPPQRPVDLLGEGIDLAIRVGEVDDASLGGRRLGSATLKYCAAPSYLERRGAPASPEDLDAHDLVLMSQMAPEGVARLPFRGPAGFRWLAARPRMRVSSINMVMEACLRGVGIAPLPSLVAQALIDRGDLVQVLVADSPPHIGLYVVYPHVRHVPPKVRAFVDLLVDGLRDVPGFEDLRPRRPEPAARPSKAAE